MVLLKILGTILFGAAVTFVVLVCAVALMFLFMTIGEKLKELGNLYIIVKIIKWIFKIILWIIAIFVAGVYLFGIGAGALESLFGIAIIL